eukprot:CCRYP_010104-RA/>CCRYP_010104-RA protein AED:0.34 eAED:0.34 QI:186/0.66/0.75/1/1/1/4/268/514
MKIDSSKSDCILPPNKRRCVDNSADAKLKILPVTLLSGFLGAGKTTLLKHILQSKNNEIKFAIIVNDMGALNLDAEEIKKHKLIQEKQEMVEMHNGCICCTLRGDLLKTVKQLAEDKKYDYLVIESTGISEPLPVAQTFAMDVNGDNEEQDHDGEDDDQDQAQDFEPLSAYARLDTLVTVIDAFNFSSILGNVESQADRENFFGDTEQETEESDESIVRLLIDQIEFANVILLNKIDLLSDRDKSVESQIKAICGLVKKLNPKATVLIPERPKFEEFDVNSILEKPFHTPETEEYGINSFVFRNNERPFHPERLERIFKNFGTGLLNEISGKKGQNAEERGIFASVVRAKGELWLSNADCCPVDVHSAGRQLVMTPAGNGRPWIAKVLEKHPYGDPESENSKEEDLAAWAAFDLTNDVLEELKASSQWTERFGDRRSELVFIGIKLDSKRLMKELEGALLNDEEFNVDEKNRKRVWSSELTDPFFDGTSLWDLGDVFGEESQDELEAPLAEMES